MPLRKRKKKTATKGIQLQALAFNLGMGILAFLVVGFVVSGIDRFFFNSGIDPEYLDLSTLITKTSYEKKTGHKIQIEIRNGCGSPKLARMYTEFLRREGIDVLDAKNADNFNYQETQILHHRGDLGRALELAEIMALERSRISADKNESLFYDLTLILGSDYMALPSYRKAVLHQPPF